MRLSQALGNLDGDFERNQQIHIASGDKLPHRLAIHQLHGDESATFGFIDVINLRDSGVGYCGGRTSFLKEASTSIAAPGQVRIQDLDGYGSAQAFIPGAINRSHAAFTEQCFDFVMLECFTHHGAMLTEMMEIRQQQKSVEGSRTNPAGSAKK
jgi:hypothetical protein